MGADRTVLADRRPVGAGVDRVDAQIVAELQADGRLSVRALAERVNISRANAYSRLERLMATGVVTGFTATVDPAKLGLHTSAYVTLNVRQNSWRQLSEALRAIPEVRHVALVGGDVDVVLLVRTSDNDDLRRVVLERLQALPGVLATRTQLIFEDTVNGP